MTNVAAYFDQRSREWEELYKQDPRFARRYELLTRFIQPLLRQFDVSRALDYGCGTGVFSRYLASNGIDVVGLDISPEMLKRAREQSDVSITYTNDLADVSSSRFDGVFALSVLEYVENVEQLLQAFAASTATNGLLVASIPNPGGVIRRMESLIFSIRKLSRGKLFGSRGDYLAHQRWKISPKEFDAMLRSLGYEKRSDMYYNAAFNLPKGILLIFERRWWAALYAGAYVKVR